MKLIIDIPEEMYKAIGLGANGFSNYLHTATRLSTPLNEVFDEIRAKIEPKCDRINSLASVLPYTTHREIQELLCEIMDLCKEESENG